MQSDVLFALGPASDRPLLQSAMSLSLSLSLHMSLLGAPIADEATTVRESPIGSSINFSRSWTASRVKKWACGFWPPRRDRI